MVIDRDSTRPDWDNLGFVFSETDVLYLATAEQDREPIWDGGDYLEFADLPLSPAAAFMSYGIGIFEGLKAQRAADGRVLLFRHRDNARRFVRSAERLVMPGFPEQAFVEAVEGVVARNERFVPPHGRGSFYVRPLQHGTEPQIGIRPSRRFRVIVFGCPVGSYFADGATHGLKLQVLEQGRVAPGGTGSAKAMGNYAVGLAVAHSYKQQGFDDVLYLDARHQNYMTETSGSNLFVKMKSGGLVTPPLDDQILAGITRDSVIRIARERLGVSVDERPVAIKEVLDDAEELFCTGTAYTVQAVAELVHQGRTHRLASSDLQQALLAELLGIQRGEKKDPHDWVTELTT